MENHVDPSLTGSLREVFDSLAKQEKSVARAILKDYPVSALTTVAGLAEASAVSTATVLRLVNRLGFETFGAFQERVKDDLNRFLQSPSERFEPALVPSQSQDGFRQRMFEQIVSNLGESAKTILDADFRDVIGLLADPRRSVYCIGGRYSRHIANLFADYLGVLRGRVQFVDGQADGWSRYLVDIGPRSIVVMLDIRRYQRTVRRFAELAKARGATLVLITDVWAETAELDPDYQFQLPGASPSLMDSLAAPMVLAESLIGAVALELNTSLRDRLALCETLDCVETNLNLAWPGIAKEGDQS